MSFTCYGTLFPELRVLIRACLPLSILATLSMTCRNECESCALPLLPRVMQEARYHLYHLKHTRRAVLASRRLNKALRDLYALHCLYYDEARISLSITIRPMNSGRADAFFHWIRKSDDARFFLVVWPDRCRLSAWYDTHEFRWLADCAEDPIAAQFIAFLNE